MLFGNTSSFYRPAGYKDPYAPMAPTAGPTPTSTGYNMPSVTVGGGGSSRGIAKPTYGTQAPAPTAQPAPMAPYPSTLQTSAPAPVTETTEVAAEPDDEYEQMMAAYMKQLQASAANPTPYGAEYYNQGGPAAAAPVPPAAAAPPPAAIPAMNIPKPQAAAQDPGAGWGTGYQQVKMPTGLGQGGGSNPIAALRAMRQGGGLY